MIYISLTNSEKRVAIDDCDVNRVTSVNWYLGKNGYAYRKVYVRGSPGGRGYESVYLHRFIMDALDGQRVDHVNRNKLDCTRRNLRFISALGNAQNHSKTQSNTFSRFKGVSLTANKSKWRAYITVGYECLHLGHFDNEIDAATAYNAAAVKHHKEFAALNDV